MKRAAFMFPGQGSQTVGMGQAFYETIPEIQTLYQKADELLGYSLSDLMFNGPQETLTKTDHAQPALLLSSVAAYTMVNKAGVEPVMTVGHSLGEYSALVATGAMSFEEALKLVKARGELMEEAFPSGQGSMAAVLGLNASQVEDVLTRITDKVVDMANINCPGQIVISGSVDGIEEASRQLKDAGAKRIKPLNVSGPFHSRLMETANNALAEELNNVTIHDVSIPVYANVTAEPATDSQTIRNLLLRQLYSPVRFEQSIREMIDAGVDVFVEVGNGKVLSGLVRKIDRSIPTYAVQDPDSLEQFMTWYKGD